LVGATSSDGVGANRLQVGSSGGQAQLLAKTSTGHASIYATGTDVYQTWVSGGFLAFGEAPSNGSTFTERARITSGGELLVGTTSAAVADSGADNLVVGPGTGNNGITIYSSNSGNANLNFADTDATTAGFIQYQHAGNNMNFRTNSAEAMRIDSSGNLLVGTTSSYTAASERFVVDGSQGNGGAGVAYIRNSLVTGADSSPNLVLYKAATTTSSSARFVQFYADNNGTPMGGIVGNGASNVQFAAISDAREKTNVQPMVGSLAKIAALKPVEFDWIKSGEHVNSGFIAQDVEEVFPEFVVENMSDAGQEARKGLTGGMTSGIIPHLVKAIQEQQAVINSLKARLDAANL
jgi:hypothetical protein